jgi:plastocyanin
LATTAVPAGAGPRDRIDEARRRAAMPLVVGRDFDYSGVPDDLRPGTYDFTFFNSSRKQDHEIAFFKVDDGTKVRDVVAAADSGDEPFFSDFRGVSFAEPLSVQRTEEFEPGFTVGRAELGNEGRYAYICFIPDVKTGKPHYQLGMVGVLDVE